MIARLIKPTAFLLAMGCQLFAWGASPAHADRCDELAAQLARQIDGVTIGRTSAGIIYLSHPAVKQASLGCSARNKSNEIFASTGSRKPAKEFFDFVASAAALVFTIPKNDALRGATRCANRIGFFRGKNIVTRYRKLDIRCNGSRDGTSIAVSRELDI
ncbi:hypothetical protein [Afipia sp. P52-10]|uniref:hypothetical protein n=1 Tax=Afipia sp. P52-10 TaxID=1429916 RepID=UPI0004B998DC|nr:hypothetical protein [Afipia sp. P52-10]